MEKPAEQVHGALRGFDKINRSVSAAISYAAGAAFLVEKFGGIPWAIAAGALAGIAGLVFDLRFDSSKSASEETSE